MSDTTPNAAGGVNYDRVGKIGKSLFLVGRYSYGIENIGVRWCKGATLKIGSFCSIANALTIYLGGNHRTDWATTYPFGDLFEEDLGNVELKGRVLTSRGDITIGHDVWIGDNVTIMSGVTIGTGAVIAANSHIIKDVLPYQIVGGNPAKLIKDRFSQEIKDLLLELEWWDMPVPVIKEIVPELCKPPTVELLQDLISRYKVTLTQSVKAPA